MDAPTPADWAVRGARAHAESFLLFASALRRGKARRDADAGFFVMGFPSYAFNGSILFAELGDLGDLVRRTRELCQPASVPWSISLRRDIAERVKGPLEAQGFREFDREPALLLPSLEREPPPLPPGLTVRRARTPDEVGVFLVTMAKGFGFPGGAIREFLRPEARKVLVGDPRTAWFVGFADGRPVATALRVAVGELSYISMVSTVPAYRKRGFGAAVTWRAALSGREAGARVGFLRATALGEPVYRKMGFVDAEGYRSFASPKLGALHMIRTIFWLLGVSLWFAVRGGSFRKAPWTSTES
jgi:GNAT superfamily N-acetyltransferase